MVCYLEGRSLDCARDDLLRIIRQIPRLRTVISSDVEKSVNDIHSL